MLSTPDAEQTETQLMASLSHAFKAINDPRADKGKRYQLHSLLSLALVGFLCGCANPSQIAVWGANHPNILRALGFHPPKRPRRKERRGKLACPNEDTLSTTLASIDTKDMNQALGRWIITQMHEPACAHVDGKALRGAKEMVLSVFIGQIRQVAWQGAIGDKENELSALEQNLTDVLQAYPHLALLTGDAAFAHKSIARAVIQEGRDYFLQIKAPHTTDMALMGDAFRQISSRPAQATSEEKRGGLTVPNGSVAKCGATRPSRAMATEPMAMAEDGKDCGRSC